MKVSSEQSGILPDSREVQLFTIENDKNITIKISNLGGTIVSLCVPDKAGSIADVVLGYSEWKDWIENPAYFNCIVGRTCNRIGGAKFSIDGTEYKVSANQDGFQLHGGFEGFHQKIWDAAPFSTSDEAGVEFEYRSADGEEGFPGNLHVKARYTLNNNNEISLSFWAVTDKPTPVNLTNHTYFNLGGEGSGNIYAHQLSISADYITATDADSIPTGARIPVSGTAYDFTDSHAIGERIEQLNKGYDTNFELRNQSGELALAATAYDPHSGRVLEVFTTEPGVQLYTSNWFDGSLTGRCGKPHLNHCAFCLETQHYPDSMNHPGFPDVILRPGEEFNSTTVWKFSHQ